MIQENARGLTLPELLAGLLILATCWHGATVVWHQLLPAQQVIAASNAVQGALHLARSEASTGGAIALCAQEDCKRFEVSRELLLLRPGQAPVTRIELPGDTSISWHSFQARPELLFHRDGRLHYQNGHLLVCHPRGQSRRLVLNRTGRARIERHDDDTARCLDRHAPR